jgi:tetratricopeptide (TPR) repeat protein
MMCVLNLRFRWVTIGLMILLSLLATSVLSHALASTPQQLAAEGKYVEAIQSLERKWRIAGRLSPTELQLYQDVYYEYAKQLLEKDDVSNAKACFLRIVSVNPRHADSHFQLGMIEKLSNGYQKAVQHLRTAISLHSKHSPEANLAIIEIGKDSLAAAEKAIEEGRAKDARAYLTFVSSSFTGEERNKSLELATYKLIPLERAASDYAQAIRLVNTRGRADAVKILRKIPENYPGTFYAVKANELLEQLGEMITVVRTSTGLELPPAWNRKETANFQVYYEKEIFFNRIVPDAERILPQIFASLGYAKPNWKKKCKIYLFSSQDDWRKFLEANQGGHLVWLEGFAIPQAMELYIYESKDTSNMLEHIVPHELTHIVHGSVVGSLDHTPRWFGEGLAQIHEKDERKNVRRKLRTLRRTPNFIPLRQLVSLQSYPPDRGRVYMFYLESLALMDLLLDNFGPVKVRDMALAYKKQTTFEAVARNVLGITIDDLEKLWKRYVE